MNSENKYTINSKKVNLIQTKLNLIKKKDQWSLKNCVIFIVWIYFHTIVSDFNSLWKKLKQTNKKKYV